ncbi:acetylglutamate kinase [Berryella intestinalis]|uniref:Acetylglutamate kinase n=1 Tax=Berryella intestinalis TaxID=1531429 RepID=A0A0A8B3Z8_9ACTN|nr:acetylglutamate kinase [Berryella intestinalis]AJC12236.1 acetylglutamate kinase [Berryella intestinalis]
MKLARDTQSRGSLPVFGEVLADALPWIKEATGKTIVIKYGGSAMSDPELCSQVMSDIVLLKIIGINLIIVHGGGKDISAAMERAAIPVEFKDGQRVTTPEAMDIVRSVMVGTVNQNLVREINRHGNLAVGVSGCDGGTLIADQVCEELGRVGHITAVNTEYLNAIIENDFIPVIAGVALGEDGGYFNINADVAAGAIAGAVGAHKLIYLTDVDGLYTNFEDKTSLISNITRDEAYRIVDEKRISSGMIPKLKSCVAAIDRGVLRAHIINGTTPHALLIELLTSSGVGTVIHRTQESYINDMHPIGGFAEKLSENRVLRQAEGSQISIDMDL